MYVTLLLLKMLCGCTYVIESIFFYECGKLNPLSVVVDSFYQKFKQAKKAFWNIHYIVDVFFMLIHFVTNNQISTTAQYTNPH
jgi:hypothetical protein